MILMDWASLAPTQYPPLCDIPSFVGFLTGLWTAPPPCPHTIPPPPPAAPRATVSWDFFRKDKYNFGMDSSWYGVGALGQRSSKGGIGKLEGLISRCGASSGLKGEMR